MWDGAVITSDTRLVKSHGEATSFSDDMLTAAPLLSLPTPAVAPTESFWVFPEHLGWVWGSGSAGLLGDGHTGWSETIWGDLECTCRSFWNTGLTPLCPPSALSKQAVSILWAAHAECSADPKGVGGVGGLRRMETGLAGTESRPLTPTYRTPGVPDHHSRSL